MNFKITSIAIAIIALMASCKNNEQKKVMNLLDPANMDTTLRPGDNFFNYANGAWLKHNPIPADKTRWGSFSLLQENNEKKLHGLLDSVAAVKNAAPGSLAQKVGDFYRTGMDSAAIEKKGIEPLKGIMERIAKIQDANGLMSEIALEQTQGIGQVYGFGIGPDDKNVTKEICQFGQGGLGLPSREYYFDKDPRTEGIREAYKAYIPKMLMMMGEDETTAKKDATDIFNLELTLAGASMTRVEMRDPYNLYHKYALATIADSIPGIDWKQLMTELNVKGQDSLLVGMPVFFKELAKELKATPIAVWKKYMQYHIVNSMSSYLSSNIDTTHFNFYGKILRGQQKQELRWKRVLRLVDGSVGDLLGQLYVEKYFTPDAKQRMMELVNNLQSTYAERIQKLDWMSEETKKKALVKLNGFMKKIGYTDKWKDYSAMTVSGDDLIKNILASSQWAYNFDLNKLGKPVDRTEWGMTPPTVNAYYNPAFNEIVFPAGILQFPFFDGEADDAVNYGGIGAVIGHEMTHGFDDEGRLYAADGNLSNWWTPADSTNFVAKANVMVNQFNAIIVIDTSHANGTLTEGENLADLGGINIAYEAFKKTEEGKSAEKVFGFTPDQRFFLSWAQVWKANTRPEEIASRLKTDPHSPSELRCNVPVSNMEAWYKAFDVKPTDKMYRADKDRARVW